MFVYLLLEKEECRFKALVLLLQPVCQFVVSKLLNLRKPSRMSCLLFFVSIDRNPYLYSTFSYPSHECMYSIFDDGRLFRDL